MNSSDQLAVSSIRVLSADAIEKAKSGHPGLPLGAAPAAYELWARHMNHNPADPKWANRDRFILSGGHGSALLYSLLHFFGYGLTMDDMKNFRQWGSLTPGHPEYGHTVGVEATTGPLGAGMGMAVGMAIAEAHLAEMFNEEGYPVVDHYTFALGGDGCMMEGISSEAFSLAGTLKLNKLIILYDSNKISIEGSTDIAFTENVQKRMEAFGFQTITVEDGNDLDAIGKAIEIAKADKTRPSFITVKTQIGYGCPAKQGKASAHGEPLGEENCKALKENIGYPVMEPFAIADGVYDYFEELKKSLAAPEEAWKVLFAEYCAKFPEKADLWKKCFETDPADLIGEDFFARAAKSEATRASSGACIQKLAALLPNLMGGSADLAPSNKTNIKDGGDFSAENYGGRNMHFGVREIAMAAIGNGMMLHGGVQAYVATFFVFSDYVKPMARMSALMHLPLTFVLTHDSIGVGEDGPTHEPIEQLSMFRAMPNFRVFRPADAYETSVGWYLAVTSKDAPTALVLTRQGLPVYENTSKEAMKGGYVLADSTKAVPDAIIMASGSEVEQAMCAKELLAADGIDVRVVSMPCMELFEEQSAEYKESVLPKAVRKRVAVEAGSSLSWGKYVGLDGAYVTIDHFGASAPAKVLFKEFGFTAENVAAAVKGLN